MSIVARSHENVARYFFAIRNICNLATTTDWIIFTDSTFSNLRPVFLDPFSKVNVPIHTIVFEVLHRPFLRGCVSVLVNMGMFVRFLKILRWISFTIVCGVFDTYSCEENRKTIYEKSVPVHAQVFFARFPNATKINP